MLILRYAPLGRVSLRVGAMWLFVVNDLWLHNTQQKQNVIS